MNLVEREILTKLQTALTTQIKSYYQGEVKVVPLSYCPALMVFGTNSTIDWRDTAYDLENFTLTIRVVMNLMAFVDEAGTGDTIKSQYALRQIMEGTDPTTFQYLPNTVLGVLRAKSGALVGASYKFGQMVNLTYKPIVAGQFFYVGAEATVKVQSELRLRGN